MAALSDGQNEWRTDQQGGTTSQDTWVFWRTKSTPVSEHYSGSGGYTSPLTMAISWSSTRPPLTRSPSCSYSLVTQEFSPFTAAAVGSDSVRGTYMSR